MGEHFFRVPQFRVRPLVEPEMRKDPIVDRWVLFSTDRLGRPQEVGESATADRLSPCPFCAGHEYLTPPAVLQLPEAGPWRVRIVPNTFPAIRGDGPFRPRSDGLLVGGPAAGLHEVVIECPNHDANLARLNAGHAVDLTSAVAARMRRWRIGRPELFPFWFKNHGAPSGASLEHAHSQLVGLPRVPELVAQEIEAGLRHFNSTNRCIFCDLIHQEQASALRILIQSARFVALAPYASRFPGEVWILPLNHGSHFDLAGEDDVAELGEMYHHILRKLDSGLDDPPLNAFIHTAPFDAPDLPYYHWHMEILPRLTGIAGFECGAGLNINPVPPEQAAEYLRSVDRRNSAGEGRSS
jgi:UDPglucose--hexose-1-phosphate uridylyltransferase